MEGDRATATKRGHKLRSAEQRKDTSMHVHVSTDRRVAADGDVGASNVDWSNEEGARKIEDFDGNSEEAFSQSAGSAGD